MIQLLQASVADGVDLQTQVKQAHWSVKGPSFRGLRELFDQVHGVVQTQVDTIAERLVTLGGVAEGTARVAAQRSRLPGYPLDLGEGRAHANALADAVARFAARPSTPRTRRATPWRPTSTRRSSVPSTSRSG